MPSSKKSKSKIRKMSGIEIVMGLSESLPVETLFEILSYSNVMDLGRASCVSKIMLIVADEVQNQPYFQTSEGDVSTIIPKMLTSSQVCPSIAIVFSDLQNNTHDGGYIDLLPSKCIVLGCDKVPLFFPPSASPAEPPILQSSVTLAHFPEAHIHSFSADYAECCSIFSGTDDIAEEFARRFGLTPDEGEESIDWKIIIIFFTTDTKEDEVVEQLQIMFPKVMIIGGLCEYVSNKNCNGTPASFEGISGVAISGNVPVKSLAAHPTYTANMELDKAVMKSQIESKFESFSKQLTARKEELLGSLLFSCSGRIPESKLHRYYPDIDIESTLQEQANELDDVKIFNKYFPNTPISGFYANGEIGPIPPPGHHSHLPFMPDEEQVEVEVTDSQVQGYTAVFGMFLKPTKMIKKFDYFETSPEALSLYVKENFGLRS